MRKSNEVILTPEMAKVLLSKNTDNFRKLEAKLVDKYASEILAGRWECNGESIKISKDGTLLDGQHRLYAVLKSGKPIKTFLTEGLAMDSVATIDRGKPRTVAQSLARLGVPSSNDVASVSRHSLGYMRGLWKNVSIQINEVLDSEIYDFALENTEAIVDAVNLAGRVRNLIPKSVLATLLFVGAGYQSPKENEVCLWLVNALTLGEGLSSTDPVLHLRNRLINSKQSPAARLSPYYIKGLLTIAWNYTVTGRECKNLRLRFTGPTAQEFPSVILNTKDHFV